MEGEGGDKCFKKHLLQLILLSIPSAFKSLWNMYSCSHITKHPFEVGHSKEISEGWATVMCQ